MRPASSARSCGMAVDDLSLVKVTETTPKLPALYIELQPSSKDKAAGIQNCLKGSLQWVDFVTHLCRSKQVQETCDEDTGI